MGTFGAAYPGRGCDSPDRLMTELRQVLADRYAVADGADKAVNIGFQDDLQYTLDNAAQKIAASSLRHQLGKGSLSSVIGKLLK